MLIIKSITLSVNVRYVITSCLVQQPLATNEAGPDCQCADTWPPPPPPAPPPALGVCVDDPDVDERLE